MVKNRRTSLLWGKNENPAIFRAGFFCFYYSLNFELFFAKSFINSTSFSTASYGIEL